MFLLETMLTQEMVKEHQVIELLLEPLLMLLKTIQLLLEMEMLHRYGWQKIKELLFMQQELM